MPTVKLVVVGSSGVGKTSLRGQYISGRFSNGYRATIGADFITKTLPHPTNPEDSVVLQIWDTAGQERFSSLSSAFFRGADAALLMFDVNAPDTMVALKKWWAEFKERAPLDEADVGDYCCVVVGNKIDLRGGDGPCVSESEALSFLDELVPPSSPCPPPIEVSPYLPSPSINLGRTSSIPLPGSSPEVPSQAIPFNHVTSSSPKHSLTRSRTRSPSRYFGTATSTRTTLTIYHTPSSSLFDSYYSARTSPEPGPSSPTGSSMTSRRRRQTKLSTGSGSSSSGLTITPSLFAREQPSSSTTETVITPVDERERGLGTPSRASLPTPPERGPKVFFASAKTGEGVSEVFEYIAQRVIRKWAYEEQMDARLLHYRDPGGDDTIRLGLKNTKPQVSLSRLAKGENILGRRPFIRWVALACIFFALFIFFAHPSLPIPRFQEEYPFPGEVYPPPPPPPPGGPPLRPPPPPPPPPHPHDPKWAARKEEVRLSFLHAWNGYLTKAFPNDEVLPVSGRSSNKFNGWAVTLVDSLDTMWLMGLEDEFKAAVKLIKRQKFVHSTNNYSPFFETIIRYLGGYLSAYALSGERVLLSLADDLGSRLLPAFNTETIGFPAGSVNTGTGDIGDATRRETTMLLAELASCQLEYKYLSKLTGRPEYYERVENVMTHLYAADQYHGLFSERWLFNGSATDRHYTAGGGTDSAYEYFLKQYLLTGDLKAKEQYLKSMEGMINKMLFITPERGLLYLTDIFGKEERPDDQLEHLSCFLPGVLALGARQLEDLPPKTRQLHQWAAEGLAYTCWVLYADQKSGLGPDNVKMVNGGRWVDKLRQWEDEGRPHGKPPGVRAPPPELDLTKRDYYYNSWRGMWFMRPETIESIYLMWKTTGDEVWRERGYAIYQAIEKHSKTTYGYSSVSTVDSSAPALMDDMPSYFLAETLKYLYLLFDDEDPIDLGRWVFNTEAHPLPVFTWDEEERAAFNLNTAPAQ